VAILQRGGIPLIDDSSRWQCRQRPMHHKFLIAEWPLAGHQDQANFTASGTDGDAEAKPHPRQRESPAAE